MICFDRQNLDQVSVVDVGLCRITDWTSYLDEVGVGELCVPINLITSCQIENSNNEGRILIDMSCERTRHFLDMGILIPTSFFC